MSAHLHDDQKIRDLQAVVDAYNAGGYQVCLCKTGFTPARDTDVATLLANEATFPGYARIPLAGGTVAVGVDGSFRATATFNPCVFTVSTSGSPEDVYGYFVITAGSALAWAQDRAIGPVTLDTAAQTYVVVPGRKLQNNPSP